MTRQDYRLIAKILHKHYEKYPNVIDALVYDFEKELLKQNPNFKPYLFHSAVIGEKIGVEKEDNELGVM